MDSLLPWIALVTIFVFIFRQSIRREMIVAGLLLVPLVLLKPLISSEYYEISQHYGGIVFFLVTRLAIAFCFGALGAAFYEIVIRGHISTLHHPRRRDLLILLLGPALLISFLIAGQPLIIGLLTALAVDYLLLISFRRDLFWDALFSGLAVGILYLVVFTLGERGIPGQISRLWFSDTLSGFTLLGMPVEEIAAAGLLGAIIGPLYPGFKSLWVKPVNTPFRPAPSKVAIGKLFLGFFLYLVLLAVYQFAFPPQLIAASGNRNERLGVREPIEVYFNRPVRRQVIGATLTASDGSAAPALVFLASDGRISRKARFLAEEALRPDTEYILTLDQVKSLWGINHPKYTLHFQTTSRPTVVITTPTPNAENVSVCQSIQVEFNQGVALNDVQYALDPPLPLTVGEIDEKNHSIKPEQCLAGNTAYSLSVSLYPDQHTAPYVLPFKTKSGVHLTSYAPSNDSVELNHPFIELNFSEPMNHDDGFPQIEPIPPGQWQWVNETQLRYMFSQLMPQATRFAVTIPKQFRTKVGEHFLEPVTVSFKTIGPPSLMKTSPVSGAHEVKLDTRIALTFSQTVDHQSSEAAFSITPAIPGSFEWHGNSMTFIPTSALTANTTYTTTIKEGVKGQFNLVSNQSHKIVFSTLTTTTLLNIAQDYQDQALSCEAAALKMALAGKGVNVSENSIMQYVGFDPTIRNGNQWGDPDSAFVGAINGKQNTTGYGVHWEPIARAARNLGRNAASFSGSSPRDIAREISQNNPVIVWGVLGNAVYDPWNTPNGKSIRAWKGEHARTVIGFKGNAEAPTHFILNDPVAGRITWTTAQLTANWSRFNNSGVIVY